MRGDDAAMTVLTAVVLILAAATFVPRDALSLLTGMGGSVTARDDSFRLVAAEGATLDVLANDLGVDPARGDRLELAEPPGCGRASIAGNRLVLSGLRDCAGRQTLAYCVRRGESCSIARVSLIIDGPAPRPDPPHPAAPAAPRMAERAGPPPAPAPPARDPSPALEELRRLPRAAPPPRLLIPARAGGDTPPPADPPQMAAAGDPRDLQGLALALTAAPPAPDPAPAEIIPPTRTPRSGAAVPGPSAPAALSPAARPPDPVAPTRGPDCPVSLSLRPAPHQMLAVRLEAPCRAGQAVTLDHAGLKATVLIGADGVASVDLPALADPAKVSALLGDGTAPAAETRVQGLDRIARVALVWSGPADLDLHGFAPGAGAHVWSGAPGDPDRARREGGAWLAEIGAALPGGFRAEVLTVPLGPRLPGPVMRLGLGIGPQSACPDRLDFVAIWTDARRRLEERAVRMALPECAAGDGLFANAGLRDLILSRR